MSKLTLRGFKIIFFLTLFLITINVNAAVEQIEWHPDENSYAYIVQVATDPFFANITQSTRTTKTKLLVNLFPEIGSYYIRIAGVYYDPISMKEQFGAFSEIKTFTFSGEAQERNMWILQNYNKAFYYFRNGELDYALEHFYKIVGDDLSLAPETIESEPFYAYIYNNIAVIQYIKKNYYKVIEYLDRAEKIMNKSGIENIHFAKIYSNLVIFNYFKGSYEKTLEYFSKYFKIVSKMIKGEQIGETDATTPILLIQFKKNS